MKTLSFFFQNFAALSSSFINYTRSYITRASSSRLPRIPKKTSSKVSCKSYCSASLACPAPSSKEGAGQARLLQCCLLVVDFIYLMQTVEVRCRGEFLYGVSPCLAAIQANRRKIHKIYIKPGVSEKKGVMKR